LKKEVKMGWQMWAAIIGGVVAIVGHWVTGMWLDVIGGAIALIGGFAMMSK
jgi:hypothetical protein